MDTPEIPQTTLRETLEANFESAEQGTLPTPEEVSRNRDEAGRFAKAEKPKEEAAETPEAKAPIQPSVQQAVQQAVPFERPTTWKKEYLPLWDKVAAGQSLTPAEAKKLVQYAGQRENEYKSGVSTYKAEAIAAKELQDALTPYLPHLQANNIRPSQWIKSLGDAQYVLLQGTPQQKLALFRGIAQQYGVPLGLLNAPQAQVPPILTELMGQVSALRNDFSSLKTKEQQAEIGALTGLIEAAAKDKVNYPHFEMVRETMAQLLELGLAPDLKTAHDKAVWMQDDAREAELLRLQQSQQRPNAVRAARAAAVSPRSATPSGEVAQTGAKDRRSLIAEGFDAISGGRV